MEYNYIINPKTNRKCNINSALGKKILKNYANEISKNALRGGKRTRDGDSPKDGLSEKSVEYLRIPIYMVHDYNGVIDDEFTVELKHGSSFYADRKGPKKPELFMDKEAHNRLLTENENDLELVKVYVKDTNGSMIEVGYYSTDEVEDYGVAWININNDVVRHKKNYSEFWGTEDPIRLVEKLRDPSTSELIDMSEAEKRGLLDDDSSDSDSSESDSESEG
tara:strand:- start:1508 stop:2170 length:663 start_codon:yes stop_codon:yes gene_type:complete